MTKRSDHGRPAPGTRPAGFARRSFHYRQLQGHGARFEPLAGAALASDFGTGPAAERETALRLGLADLSPLPRIGFKGAGAPQWLEGQGLALPAAPNLATRQADGGLLARLSRQEHLLLCDPGLPGDACRRLEESWSMDSAGRCYLLPRRDSHFWFALTGRHGSDALAKLCGVDLRPHRFADGCVAQTSVARLHAIVIRGDIGTTSAFFLLADSAAADYLWPCLLDAMQEFDGRPIGLRALRALGGR